MSDNPYLPPSFTPSSEPCVMPSVIEEKPRLRAGTGGSVQYRGRDVGDKIYADATWYYFNGTAYVATTDRENVKIRRTSTQPRPAQLPYVTLRSFDEDGTLIGTTQASNYIEIVTTTTTSTVIGVSPTTTTETIYVSGLTSLRSQLNFGGVINAPTQDDYSSWQATEDDPNIVGWFTKTELTFSLTNGSTIIAKVDNPADVRTGPTLTLANLDSSEKDNNTGTFVPGIGSVKYNYDTLTWDKR